MRVVAILGILVCLAWPAAGQTASADQVLAGYMRLYSGEKEAAYKHFQALRAGDPTSLPKRFGLLFTQVVRIELDPSLAPAFERDMEAFLDAAEQRYSRSKADSEALFHLEAGYLLRSRYRIDNDKGVFGAARDAAKAKGYGDEYIKRHPEHGDAYFALGLYNYYVDIAPNFVKVLRVLLFLPSGSRVEGMKQLERAGRDGSLFAPMAQGALSDIYGSLEGRLADAIAIDERLVQRFPGNTELRFNLAQWCMHPSVEAYDRAAEQYTAVLNHSTSASLEHTIARHQATLGMANLRRSQWRLEDGIALLTPTIDRQPDTPVWAMPNFLLRRANYRALLNDPAAAEDARRVLANPKWHDWHKGAQGQITFIDNRRKTGEAEIYAALLAGNRLTVEHKWDEAIAVYDRVAAAHPGNWQARYRRAYLEFLRGQDAVAARGFTEIVSSTAPMPSWLKAAAMVNLAWTHDLAGRRADALKLYKRVVDDYENESSSGVARVGLISAYRR